MTETPEPPHNLSKTQAGALRLVKGTEAESDRLEFESRLGWLLTSSVTLRR